MKEQLGFGSICSHEFHKDTIVRPSQLPIFPTSSFRFENVEQGIDAFLGKNDVHIYSRYANPTIDAVAEKIARLEGYGIEETPIAFLTSSGMGAISTLLMATAKQGQKVLTQSNLYGGTAVFMRDVLAHFGVEVIHEDFKNLEAIDHQLATHKDISLIYMETPANPTMSCVDLKGISTIAKRHGVYTAVDNTFCTPYLQQPLSLGIDFVVHSTTKFINGHGTSVSGVIVGKDIPFMKEVVWKHIKLIGTNANAFDAWLVNNGLKTLAIRMERHCENAMAVANFLELHPLVNRVNYNGLLTHPDHELAKKQMKGFGGMMSFELEGGLETGKQFIDALNFCTLAPTLGDVDTIVLHPASSSHIGIPKTIREANGITDGLVRLSVGIEDIGDILEDLDQAIG